MSLPLRGTENNRLPERQPTYARRSHGPCTPGFLLLVVAIIAMGVGVDCLTESDHLFFGVIIMH